MAGNEVTATPSPPSDRLAELEWVDRHRRQFANKWVVVKDDRLIASGDDARKVYLAARRRGIKVPFLVQVEPPDSLPFGGW